MADNLEPSTFPIQKGSLSLLRQKWESSDYQRNESYPGGSRCKLFQLKESKLLEPEGEALSALDPLEPPSLPCSRKEEVLSGEPEYGLPEDQSDKLKDCGQPEVLKEDSLTGRRRIERFSIALDELRSIFESPKSGMNPAGPVDYVQKVRSYLFQDYSYQI
ncbi:uncharacterized protein LOC110318248 [Mus pahari]|uniref:uncharacterized protein LOC110318248 n=1 Tax=Mus pahari TaxID=10093 RepID=UPI000A31345D|nr:uncharacterized protein LOC110318248 [Mus pahari]